MPADNEERGVGLRPQPGPGIDTMTDTSGAITVRILGEPFRIRGGDAREIERLARFVEAKLEEIRSRNEGLPLRNQLMLTSLNIAEELFRERAERERLVREVEERAKSLCARLDAQMGTPNVREAG